MKLSAAIRIGSMTTKQIKLFFSDGGNGRCALGAAMDACNMRIAPPGVWQAENMMRVRERFPILAKETLNPVTHKVEEIRSIIWKLNDVSGWTREEISNWVERIENQLEQKETQRQVKAIINEVCR